MVRKTKVQLHKHGGVCGTAGSSARFSTKHFADRAHDIASRGTGPAVAVAAKGDKAGLHPHTADIPTGEGIAARLVREHGARVQDSIGVHDRAVAQERVGDLREHRTCRPLATIHTPVVTLFPWAQSAAFLFSSFLASECSS